MSGPQRSVGALTKAVGLNACLLAVIVSAIAMPADAQRPRRPDTDADKAQTPPVVEIRAPIGPRPEFYVPWGPNPPGLTAKPALRLGGQPKYPAESIKAKETGFTTLELCITAKGRPTDIRVVSSSGFPRLDQALLAWLPTATYSPAKFHGAALAICGYRLTYEWRIDTDRTRQL